MGTQNSRTDIPPRAGGGGARSASTRKKSLPAKLADRDTELAQNHSGRKAARRNSRCRLDIAVILFSRWGRYAERVGSHTFSEASR